MRSRIVLLAASILLLALLLRAEHAVTRGGLWRDEANAYYVVRESASVGELIRNLKVESSPPLQPLLEYAVHRVAGSGLGTLRALSILLGTLTVLGILLLGWRAFHPACGILAALLAAASPYLIRVSGELRSYPLFGLLAVVHAGAYLRYVERRGMKEACLWGLSAAALAWTHYYAFPIILCAGLGALAGAPNRAEAARCVAAGATFLLAYAPWLPTFLLQFRSDLQPWYLPRTDPAGLLTVFRLPLGRAGAYLLVAALLSALLSLRRGAASGAEPRDVRRLRCWSLLALGAAPAALAWVMQVYRGAFDERYLVAAVVPLLPAACVHWSTMFQGHPLALPLHWRGLKIELSGALRRRLAWALLAAAFTTQILDPARWLRPSSPAREFAELVERSARPGDLIWIFPAPYASSFNFHFDGPQAQLAFPFRGRVTRVEWINLRVREQDPAVIQEFLDELASHLDRGGRVWALFVESLRLDEDWAYSSGPAPADSSRLARAEYHVHRHALRLLYARAKVVGWWDRPHLDYHEGLVLALFAPGSAALPVR
ncbi:MAG: hypothetical protein ACT4PV_00255 [Planctomycetaceae bacterium]